MGARGPQPGAFVCLFIMTVVATATLGGVLSVVLLTKS